MKYLILIAAFSIFVGKADAQEKGMNFETNTTWEKVLSKAKAENKYIFVDCFTTWCGPCKQMSNNVFTQPEVGDFFNAKYVNVAIQMDSTKKDDDYVKSWYGTSHDFFKNYNVRAYPTYLIFNPSGELAHRFVGSMAAKDFIAAGKKALNPESQYYTQLRKFEAGGNTPKELLNVLQMSVAAMDNVNSKKIADDYFPTQTDLYTKENLELIAELTRSSKDIGFKMMMDHPDKVDAGMGRPISNYMVRYIIMREEFYPQLIKLKKGEKPNWKKLKQEISAKYPAKADEVISFGKIVVAQQTKKWKEYGRSVKKYYSKFGQNEIPAQLNSFAWTMFLHCQKKSLLKSALKISNKSLEDTTKSRVAYMDTYANILYKLGKKQEAIEFQEKAQTIAFEQGESKTWGKETLDKMKNDEKTWED